MKTILILFALSIPPPHVSRPIPQMVKQQESALWKGCELVAFDVKLNAKSFICTDKKNRRFEVKVTPLFDSPLGEW